VAFGDAAQLRFPLDADAADLAEPGGDDDEPLDALPAALFGHRQHGVRGHHEHGEVDVPRDRPHGGERWHRQHDLGVLVDRVDRALEPTGDQVGDHLPADGTGPPAGADDRDGSGSEDAVQPVRACSDHEADSADYRTGNGNGTKPALALPTPCRMMRPA
jgi:hypothetical protein